MRWTKRTWIAALLLAALTGCKQQCFIKECDWCHTRDNLAGQLELNYHASDPAVSVVHSSQPNTVLDPERPAHYMCLAEAISLALEHGTTGQPTVTGQVSDILDTDGGLPGSRTSSDQIR